MVKIRAYIDEVLGNIPGSDADELRRNKRIQRVHQLWSELVEENILEHTNAVYISDDNGEKVLRVYVDESIYAAELNNRREMLLYQMSRKDGADIARFDIFVSYGTMKTRYPYRQVDERDKTTPSVPLDQQELETVEGVCSNIDDESLRSVVKQAMINDLEWKKGIKQ